MIRVSVNCVRVFGFMVGTSIQNSGFSAPQSVLWSAFFGNTADPAVVERSFGETAANRTPALPLNYFTGNVTRPMIRFGRDFNRLELATLEEAFLEQDEDTVRRTWKTWREQAQNGDMEARERIYTFWVNRMSDELVNAETRMIRFDNGEITDGPVDPASLREKAIFGLYAYYLTNRGLQKKLTANVEHLFAPLMAIVEDTSLDEQDWEHHPRIWGEALLNIIYPNLKPWQQTTFLENQKTRFMQGTGEEERQRILPRLAVLHEKNPDLPFWDNRLRPELAQWIETIGKKQAPGDREEAKYPLLLLSLTGETPAALHKFSGPGEDPDLQVAVAWIAGHKPTQKHFDLLKNILKDDAHDERAREMALLSLGEYLRVDQHKEKALEVITAFLPGNGQPDTPLEEAAFVVTGKEKRLSDLQQPGHYIREWLETDADREEYRRLRDRYIVSGFDELGTAARNMVDRVLIPYRKYLPDLISAGRRHIITSAAQEAVTEMPECREYLGIRTEDGSLYDSMRGVALPNGYAVTAHANIRPDGTNDFAHEFFHHIHDDVLKLRAERDYSNETAWSDQVETVQKRIDSLYRSAVDESRTMDYYAATEDSEYMAQGNSAYDVRFIHHADLMSYAFSDGYHDHLSNIRSKLMRRDRPLYDFLESLPDKLLWKNPTSVRIRITSS